MAKLLIGETNKSDHRVLFSYGYKVSAKNPHSKEYTNPDNHSVHLHDDGDWSHYDNHNQITDSGKVFHSLAQHLAKYHKRKK